MMITTSSRPNSCLILKAKEIAKEWGERFVSRGEDSVEDLQKRYIEDVIVVGKQRLELFLVNQQEPIFFHPNSAMYRIKRLMNGSHDPFVDACGLKNGMHFLDCTLGLGSDSIVASFSVGKEGSVVSLEGNKTLAYLIKSGLSVYDSGIPAMNNAMKSINVIHMYHQDYLIKCKDNSIDVIYFDPMFEAAMEESPGISGVKKTCDL